MRSIALVALLILVGPTPGAERLNCYAGPNVWGPSTKLVAHLGKATYTVEYTVVGKTTVVGEVTYWETKDRQVTREFYGSIRFTTADVVAAPSVRFKGIPFGSAVKVVVR